MREANWFERLVWRIKDWWTNRDKGRKAAAEERSNKLKAEMCGRAVRSGVCPECCERCAWEIR